MDATQAISDSILESDEEEKEENQDKRGKPLAKLCILKNQHISERELPLFLGENVVGRDPSTCNLLLPAPSVSKQHATICLSVYRTRKGPNEMDMEALVWDRGSMNGTHKGRLKLTPNVRYALSDADSLVFADIPCQYVSCGPGTASSQPDTFSTESTNSAEAARVSDVFGEIRSDTGIVASTLMLSPKRRAGQRSCLSLEQTPNQEHGTLVPESDSDSESQIEMETLHKTHASDSDSHKSSPKCSTFLSPQNTTVPESEDESLNTSSYTKNGPQPLVSITTEEQNLVNSSTLKEEQRRKDESSVKKGTSSEDCDQHQLVLDKTDLHISAPEFTTSAISVLNTDDDSHVAKVDTVTSSGTSTLNAVQESDRSPHVVQFDINSDTDIDEEEDLPRKDFQSLPANTSPVVISVAQPEGNQTNIDADKEEDAVSDAATKAKSTSFQSAADSAPPVQLTDSHLDSDTDIDEESKQIETSDILETPKKSELKPFNAVPRTLSINSDTDDDDLPALTVHNSPLASAVRGAPCAAVAAAELDILSDSDTDLDDEVPFTNSDAVSTSVASSHSNAPQSNSDANINDSAVPPVADRSNPLGLSVDSDTDVEGKDTDVGEREEEQVLSLQRENTPGMLTPFLQNCSTPIQLTDGAVEEMETQGFTSPSSGPFRLTADVRPVGMSSSTNCQAAEEEDFIVAETQSFVLHPQGLQACMEPTQEFVNESHFDKLHDKSSRVETFQLGLSDSSHLQSTDKDLALESPGSIPLVEVGVHLEETQAYTALSHAHNVAVDSDSKLEFTSTEEVDDELVKTSGVPVGEDNVDMALQATQAYISSSFDDLECHAEEEESQSAASTESLPLDLPNCSTLATAETQLMVPYEEVSDFMCSSPVTDGIDSEVKHSREEAHILCETQPMQTSDHEDQVGGTFSHTPTETTNLLKGEQILAETQPISAVESSPMAVSEDEESDAYSTPKSEKRKAEQPPTQAKMCSPTSAQGCAAESKPHSVSENEQSHKEDLIQSCQHQKAKLQQSEQKTEPLLCKEASSADTQPADTDDDEDSPDFILGTRKRKAKPLQIDDESQSQTTSEVGPADTQPLSEYEVGQSHKEGVSQVSQRSENEQGQMKAQSDIDQREKLQRNRRTKSDQGSINELQKGVPETNVKKIGLRLERGVIQEGEERKEACERVNSKKKKVLVEDDKKRSRRGETEMEEIQRNKIKEPQASPRGRRASRRTGAAQATSTPQCPVSADDDVPARRTRSRSNSSNSVGSEQSASSSITQESKGRGQGRGRKRTSDSPQTTPVRRTRQRTGLAVQPLTNNKNDQELNLKPNLSSSRSPAIRGRGGRQQGRGRKTELVSDLCNQSESAKLPAPTESSSSSSSSSSRRRRKTEGSSTQSGVQLSCTTRGKHQVTVTKTAASDLSSSEVEGISKQEPFHPKRNVRGGAPKTEKNNGKDTVAPNVNEGSDEGRGKVERSDLVISNNIRDDKEEAAESERKIVAEFRSPAGKAKTRTRPSSAHGKVEKSGNQSKGEEEVGNVERTRGRPSAVPKKKKKNEEESEISNVIMAEDENVEESEPPRTPITHLSRKRRAPAVSSPAAKSPRPFRASPASVSGRHQAASQSYKVLFTGLVDEAGEKVLARLGGTIAKGVDDMNCLVTDKVRRTVKFLCAVAKGVPVVTTNWLEKSGKAGSFLDPNAFLVKDPEQETKFSFCLHDSLNSASQQRLLQGYEIHVTKSVKPEPAHMKDIISSSGATFLSKMPSSQMVLPQTLVISCDEDWQLCAPALSASVPVVTAEFILTGILQQRIDFQAHKLCAPLASLQPAAGRARSRKKT